MTHSKRLNVADNFCARIDACCLNGGHTWKEWERQRAKVKKNGSKMQGGSFAPYLRGPKQWEPLSFLSRATACATRSILLFSYWLYIFSRQHRDTLVGACSVRSCRMKNFEQPGCQFVRALRPLTALLCCTLAIIANGIYSLYSTFFFFKAFNSLFFFM